jgi:hypothetical protein
MEKIYFDPKHPASFGGIQKLYESTNSHKRKEVSEWLKAQRVYTLHKPSRKKFNTRKTRTSHHNGQWQADLNDIVERKKKSHLAKNACVLPFKIQHSIKV